jgi:hypothetical protein
MDQTNSVGMMIARSVLKSINYNFSACPICACTNVVSRGCTEQNTTWECKNFLKIHLQERIKGPEVYRAVLVPTLQRIAGFLRTYSSLYDRIRWNELTVCPVNISYQLMVVQVYVDALY